MYIPTDARTGGRDQCVTFYGHIDRLYNVVGNCSRVSISNSHLTMRRRHRSGRGDVAGARIVRFSRTCFGNGSVCIFSSIMAAKTDCTVFTGRLRVFNKGMLKNLFLKHARCGCTG